MNRKTKQIAMAASGLLTVATVSLVLFVRHNFQERRIKNEENDARNLVARFHANFNLRDFDGICRDWVGCNGSDFADRVWNPVIEDVKSKCGAFRQVVSSSVEATVEPSPIRAVYVSAFERGQLREVFALLNSDPNGPLKIANYLPIDTLDGKSHPEACWHLP